MANSDQYTVNSSLSAVGTGIGSGPLNATFTVTYGTTRTVSGNATFSELGVAPISFTINSITKNADGTFTVSGPGNGLNFLQTVSITYSGTPTTNATFVSASVGPLGVPAFSGTSGNITTTPVCFVSGTLIRTRSGDVEIEKLNVGDMVITASGEQRAIKWLSHQTISCRDRGDQQHVMPIKISKDAFACDMPAKDLFVSPGHAICVSLLEEILVPAAVLVNGTTITQVDVDSVTYWHLELDSHDIVLANNLPSETYVDVGNRSFFLDGSGAVDPDRSIATLADYCRPFTTHPTFVGALRRMLRLRAIKLGWTLDESPLGALHMIVDGATVKPQVRDLVASFQVNAQAKDVWLVSQTSVPAHLDEVHDARSLGVLIKDIAIDDGFAPRRHLDLRDGLFSEGFSHVEDMHGVAMRWTSGRARIPSEFWSDCSGSFLMRVELNAAALPRWVKPAEQAVAPVVLTLVKAA